MTEPVRASNTPLVVQVEKGKSYYWCACGKSKKQPLCDGAHAGSEFMPMKYVATETKAVYFCGCKQTVHPPLCDGSHNKK